MAYAHSTALTDHPDQSARPARVAGEVEVLVRPSAEQEAAALAAAEAGALVIGCHARGFADESRAGSAAWATLTPLKAARRAPPAANVRPDILFVAPRQWLSRALSGLCEPGSGDARTTGFYLDDRMNGLMVAALDGSGEGFLADLHRAAKRQELLCELLAAWRAGALTPRTAGASFGLADAERLMQARQVIAQRYAEKLTLDSIARACGLNRAKLTQGFRELFNQSVAEALAEQRLLWAARELRASSLPVASVGYAAGYLNNASFARAFSKRFGQCPTDYRRAPLVQQPALTAIAA